jgi:hypothetical protein
VANTSLDETLNTPVAQVLTVVEYEYTRIEEDNKKLKKRPV